MKKKSAIVVSLVSVIIIATIICIMCIKPEETSVVDSSIVSVENCIEKFNKKLELINLDELSNEINESNDNIIIISICDLNSRAIVKSKRGQSLKEIYNIVKNEVNEYIVSNEYNPEWVRIDVALNIEEKSANIIRDLKKAPKNSFKNGIILGNDIILMQEELNANRILDYENGSIDKKKLQSYLQKKITMDKPESVEIFDTVGYFIDEKNEVHKINSNSDVIRNIDDEKENIKYIIENGANYLANLQRESGEFIYGYYAQSNKEINNYNILRHAGSTWSLIVECDVKDSERKNIIINALNYLIEEIKSKDDKDYILESKTEELKLGGNALATIAICEYTKKFNDNRYIQIAKRLGNGIIDMQKENGKFVHVLNEDNFSVKDEERTVYYDGEAIFALCKLYGITKEKKYLDSAEKGIRYCMNNDYIEYTDHWIEYAMNEVVEYTDNVEYYEFGLRNVFDSLEYIRNKKNTSHVNFEMLIQCFELYNKAKERNINFEYINNISLDDLIEVIKYRAWFQLKSYMYPELAMFLQEPKKYAEAFYISTDHFRIRIDDIQHSIVGYIFYSKNYDKI